MRKINLTLLITLILTIFSLDAFSKSGVQFRYSEAVDVFEIMDNVSKWHEANNPSYFEYFNSKFSLSKQDLSMLDEYKTLRLKYFKPVRIDEAEGLFKKNYELPPTSFALAFYESISVGEALKKLMTRTVSKKEAEFLAKFYNHFKKKITTMVKESTVFKVKVLELKKRLKKGKLNQIFKKAHKFLNIDKRIKEITIFSVWLPESEMPSVSIMGKTIILRVNPISKWSEVDLGSLQEAVIGALLLIQSNNQKDNLSKLFSKKCNIKTNIKTIDILSSPLKVVFGKMFFEKNIYKRKFDNYKEWSIHPWINVYSKLLFPLVESSVKKRLNIASSEFIERAALICKDLTVLNTFMNFR